MRDRLLFLWQERRKSVIITASAAILIFGLVWIRDNLGDVRPGYFPASENLPNLIDKQAAGSPVEIPLKLPDEFKIGVFAKDLGHARDLEFSPGGTLLVSATQRGRVLALPDQDNDGQADLVKEVLTNLALPHGLAFHEGKLFVAEELKVTRYHWDEGSLTATKEKDILSLPAKGSHFTRGLVIKGDGTLFASIGSTCNACIEADERYAAVLISDTDGNSPRVFAKGLRNTVFITLNPETNELWGADMGRDLLGDNIPSEEINIIRDGKDYGWPYCYNNRIHDSNFDRSSSATRCQTTEPPIYEFQAHSAPLGLTFINSPQFPANWQGDLLVAYHGSWNRSTPTGYKVVRMKVDGDRITDDEDFLTGFLQGSEALGRPGDVIFDKAGSLYISDTKAAAVYKIVKK